MEWKTEGLVLRAVDYKDNDKILTVFTPSRGKITAGIKGVKKPKSKLNFAAQPFAFCEYVLSCRGDRNTVIGAYLHDGFFALRTDITRYYAACALVEIIDKLLVDGVAAENLFIAAVNGLKNLCFDQSDAALSLLSFVVLALSECGYMLDLSGCICCGEKIGADPYFDFENGGFLCRACGGGVRASESTYHALSKAAHKECDEQKAALGYKRALRLVKAYLSQKTGEEFPCLGELIRLMDE
jgi:DNA repair protein RecO (recombination protein O)